MIKLSEESEGELWLIWHNFTALLKDVKSEQSWDDQQKYEWSIPDYSMFQDLLLACIQDKHVR